MLERVVYAAPEPASFPVAFYTRDNPFQNAPPVKSLTCHGPAGLARLCSIFSQTLTHLVLLGARGSDCDVQRAEAKELTCALRQTTALTHLELINPGFGYFVQPSHPLMLPNLQRLLIRDSILSAVSLVGAILYPSTAVVTLECTAESIEHSRLFHTITGAIGHLLQRLQSDIMAPKIVHLGVEFHPTPCIRASTTSDASTCQDSLFTFSLHEPTKEAPSPSPFNKMPMLPLPLMDTFCDILQPIVKALRQSVVSLDVGPYDPPRPSNIQRHLSPLVGKHSMELPQFPAAILDIFRELENLEDVRWSLPVHRGAKVDIDTLRSVHAAFKNLRCVSLTGCRFVSSSGICQQTPASDLYFHLDSSPTLEVDSLDQLEGLTLRSCEGLCTCQLARLNAIAETVHLDLTPLVKCRLSTPGQLHTVLS